MNDLRIILPKTLSADNNERNWANSELEKASGDPCFLNVVLEALRIPDCACAAVAFLKQHGVAASAENQVTITVFLLEFLENERHAPKALARLAASVISQCTRRIEDMCFSDSLEHETQSLTAQYNVLRRRVLDTLSRSLDVEGVRHPNFLYLVLEMLSDSDAESVVRQDIVTEVVPRLFQILAAAPTLDYSIRARDVLFLEGLDILMQAYCTGDEAELRVLFQEYFDAMSQVVFIPATTILANYVEKEERRRIRHLCNFFVEVCRGHRWALTFQDAALFRGVMHSLFEDSATHFQLVSAVAECGGDDEDGPLAFMQCHAACRWSFLGLSGAAGKKSNFFQAFGSEKELYDYCSLMMNYSVLSPVECSTLVADVNSFLQEEEDRELNCVPSTLRESVGLGCVQQCRGVGVPFAAAALRAVGDRILHAESAPINSNVREGILFLLQCMIGGLSPKISRLLDANLMMGITKSVVACDAMGGSPLQVARALALLPRLLKFFELSQHFNTSELRASLVALALNGLTVLSSSEHQLVKISTVRFLFCIIPLCSAEELSLILPQGCQLLCEMICDSGLPDECLYIVLETVHLLLQQARRKAASSGRLATPLPTALISHLFLCWRNHLPDPNVGELVRDAVKEVLRCSPQNASMLEELLWMKEMLCSVGETFCAAPNVIAILTDVFKYGDNGIGVEAVGVMLGPLVHVILSVENEQTSVLQSTLKCLASLLARASGEVVMVQVSSELMGAYDSSYNNSGQLESYSLTNVLAVVALRLLHPSLSEVALFNVKKDLSMMLGRLGDFTDEEAAKIISAIATRLQTVKTSTVMEQLLVPLSQLFCHHCQAVCALLVRTEQLVPLCECWLRHLLRFASMRDIICSCCALLHLLSGEAKDDLASFTLERWTTPRIDTPQATASGKLGREKTSNNGAGPDGDVRRSVPLDVAVFITVGKAVVLLSRQWNEDEEISVSSSLSDASLFSDSCASDAMQDGDGEGEPHYDHTDPSSEASCARLQVLCEMQQVFRGMNSLGVLYKDAVVECFTNEEVRAITEFLSMLYQNE